MERFAIAIVTGGVSLVAGLWLATLLTAVTIGWMLGIVLVLLGLGGMMWGIWTQLGIDLPTR